MKSQERCHGRDERIYNERMDFVKLNFSSFDSLFIHVLLLMELIFLQILCDEKRRELNSNRRRTWMKRVTNEEVFY
jgi:hypothetical protein